MSCGQLCKWNDPAAGCVKPDWEMCLMSNIASPEKPKTNEDRIRVSDKELRYLVRAFIIADDCPVPDSDCHECALKALCESGDKWFNREDEWLQQPAEEEE